MLGSAALHPTYTTCRTVGWVEQSGTQHLELAVTVGAVRELPPYAMALPI
ncbi:hypothetical protein H6F88_22175 [Oculatella sp. FACHB-28]|nr:hypothetical protein [Oculatella sp. FACHB-28]MBD2058673.1 hypothetical protein [Oculatella sp. FACHB-28]